MKRGTEAMVSSMRRPLLTTNYLLLTTYYLLEAPRRWCPR